MVEFCDETEKWFESSFGIEMHYPTPDVIRKLVNNFSELTFEVRQVKTMKGKSALAVNYFGKNDTYRSLQQVSAALNSNTMN